LRSSLSGLSALRIICIASLGEADLLEVADALSEAMEVEVVSDVVLVDLNEELVSLEVAEPLNPARAGLRIVVVVNIG
jgi:hypothetical protein